MQRQELEGGLSHGEHASPQVTTGMEMEKKKKKGVSGSNFTNHSYMTPRACDR